MVGIFDSGIGGLTVVKEFFLKLPQYQIIYFGDTARLPYGTKSPEFVMKWSKEIVKFLLKNKVQAIIIACHTSSALAGNFLKKEFPKIPIFEIITPGVISAQNTTKNKKIGIIATPATIKSGVHKKQLLILQKQNNLKIYEKACPLFVPLIEEGWIDNKATKEIAKEYLNPLKNKGIDTLVLGCTHYPLLQKVILETMGKKIQIINPASQLILEFQKFLVNNPKLEKKLKKGKKHKFFVSDNPYNFQIMSKLSLGKKVLPRIIKEF